MDAAIHGQTVEQIKATITAQDAFASTLNKLKDKLSQLVDNNILDKLTQIIVAFVNTVSGPSGFKGLFTGAFSENLQKIKEADINKSAATASGGLTTMSQKATLSDIRNRAAGAHAGGIFSEDTYTAEYRAQARQTGKTFDEIKEADQEKNRKLLESIQPGGSTVIGKQGDITSTYWEKMSNTLEQLLDHTKAAKESKIYIGANAITEGIGIHTNRVGNT